MFTTTINRNYKTPVTPLFKTIPKLHIMMAITPTNIKKIIS